jgi:branched-subunit amino acid transport protein
MEGKMSNWIWIGGMGLITFGIRLFPILLLERMNLHPTLQRGLRYVPVAVLSAIIFPELFMPGGTLDLSLGNARLTAGLIATGVAFWRKNVLLTILVGMVVLWVIQ